MSAPVNDPHRPDGAHPVGERKRRAGWWWWLLLALLAVAVVVALLARRGGDDPTVATPSPSSTASVSTPSADVTTPSAEPSSSTSATTPSQPSATPATSAASDGQASATGTVTTSEGIVLGDTTPSPLQGRAGQQATGTGVLVQSVPADEGFWVGTSVTNRIWVQLTGAAGESTYQVKQGDTVDFTGTVADHDATFATTAGVTQAEGAGLLTQQGGHIDVDKKNVTLSQ